MTDIAVVIPCFNLGRTVEEAVDSVIAQTRAAAEIVVVDDGSSEAYTRWRLALLSRPRLRVVRIEHAGASRARNAGVALTSAPYLLLLDADDALDPTYLEKTGACLDGDSSLDFVSTGMQGFGEASYVWTPPPPELTATLTRATIPITTLLRRRVWDSVGGFDEELPTAMDLDFWVTALEYGFRGRVIDEPLLRRRVRSDSLHHADVSRGSYQRVRERIFWKHRATIERIGPELLVAKEGFIDEQRSDRTGLEQRVTALHSELELIDGQIAQHQQRLRERGQALVDFGDLRRLAPVSPVWGIDRGRPVDRYYIERFLAAHRADIRGRVLEIKEPVYTEMFGSPTVSAREVLDIVADNPRATIVADLTRADSIPSESFDCFILTQTLHIIYDVRAALFHAHRILKPGGVLLATLPAVSRINYEDGGLDAGDFWRVTEASLTGLFGGLFSPANVDVVAGGNLKACIAFLYGLATEEMQQADLDALDSRTPLVFCVRAVKPGAQTPDVGPEPGAVVKVGAQTSGAIIMYHRVGELSVDPHGLCVSPTEFVAHMQYLSGRHPVLPLEDFARRAANGDLPESAIAVTFDDGTLDALESASPILLELGIPATFFVNTERLEEEHEPWWDVLGRILLADPAVPAVLDIMLGRDRHVLALGDADRRRLAYSELHHWLMRATLAERDATMARIVEWSGVAASPRRTHRLLLASEIRQLAERPGHSIGSHSVHHLLLTSQAAEQRDREIRESKHEIERVVERPVVCFSYPYGAHDRDVAGQVRAAGFAAAVTTVPGVVSGGTDVYVLPRFDVKRGPVEGLAQMLKQAFLRTS